jgi:hypothetical protein
MGGTETTEPPSTITTRWVRHRIRSQRPRIRCDGHTYSGSENRRAQWHRTAGADVAGIIVAIGLQQLPVQHGQAKDIRQPLSHTVKVSIPFNDTS